MKKRLIFIVFTLFLVNIIGQNTIVIKGNDGETYNSISVGDIEKITFHTGCPATVNYGGRIYTTVVIGNQCWFKENINVGTLITGTSEQTNNGSIEKYCYENIEDNCISYGGLYQWNEAMQYVTTEGAQGICPDGWHVPTFVELGLLRASVNYSSSSLRAIGQISYSDPGNDKSGFSALLTGIRFTNGGFGHRGKLTDLWSSKQEDAENAKYLHLRDYTQMNFNSSKNLGMSIRCKQN